MEGQRNPDIQRLLANLRNGNLQTPVNSTSETNPPYVPSRSGTATPVSRSGLLPGLGLLAPEERSKAATPVPPQTLQVPRVEVAREQAATPVIPDASTITTWPAALKHVTKHVVTNEAAVNKIKHLIAEQHKHERQWWAGREAIVTRHSGRAGNQAKVADLLKSLGGAAVPVVARDHRADQAELEAYDKKVYKSLMDMTADFDRQLRRLQIPFFAIKHELVILESGVQQEGALKGRLDKGELRELQRRMAETLQDLVADD